MNHSTNMNPKPSPFAGKGMLVLCIVLIAANLRAAITSVGPLMGAIQADTGVSNVLAGLLTTLPLLAFAALSMLAPKIAARWGTERTIFTSLIVLIGGILLRSVPSLPTLYVGTAILGLAIAVGNVLLPSLIKRDFAESVGLMTGLFSLSMNIFAALASGISVPLAEEVGLGWRGALVCWAVLALIAILLFLPAVRSVKIKKAAQKKGIRNAKLWRSKLAWQVTLFMGLQSTAFYTTVAWLPDILHSRGMSVSTSGWMLSLMQTVSMPTTFLVPLFAARFSNQRAFVIGMVILSLVGYVGLCIGGNSLTVLWIICFGIAQGASISLALMFIALRAPNTRVAAQLSGMAQSIGYLLAATGPLLFGFLHDVTNSWNLPILLLVVVSVLMFFVGIGAGSQAVVTQDDSSESPAS